MVTSLLWACDVLFMMVATFRRSARTKAPKASKGQSHTFSFLDITQQWAFGGAVVVGHPIGRPWPLAQ